MHSIFAIAAALGLAAAMIPGASRASELKVLVGGAMAASMKEIAPKFEKASGHTLVMQVDATPGLIKAATSGAPFDAGLAPVDVFKDEGARTKFAPGPMADIARVGFGVAVRSGAPKPDLSTPEKFKQAMLKAQSISTLPASAAGSYVLKVFDKLGISDAMKAKTRAQASPPAIAEAVAKGDAELAIFLTNVLIAPGVELAGPFPGDLQQELLFKGAVAAGSKNADAAKALLAYLKSPEAIAVFKAKGVTPG